MTSTSEVNARPTVALEPTVASHTRLGGDFALCAAEGWPRCPTDPERAYRGLTAPGCAPLVALDGDAVAGLVQLHSDGDIQAHRSRLVVARGGGGAGSGAHSCGQRSPAQEAFTSTC